MKTFVKLCICLGGFLIFATTLNAENVVINVVDAGSLSELIGTRKDTVTHLTLQGKLNGTDIKCIRQMNKLICLDMRDVDIVAGGKSYGYDTQMWCYRDIYANNHIDYLMFDQSGILVTDEYNPQDTWTAPIQKIILPESATCIDDYAFQSCITLKELTISDKVEVIGFNALAGCIALETINLPVSLKKLEDAVFYNCPSLGEITIAKDNDYYSCVDGVLFTKELNRLIKYPSAKKSTHYAIPENVTVIANCAFDKVADLVSVSFPGKLHKIEARGFCYSEISSIDIPASVDSLSNAFYYCNKLSTITVDPASPYYKTVDNVLFTRNGKILELYPKEKTGESYSIPVEVERIVSWGQNPYIEKVFLPSSVKEIQSWAFYNCTSLKIVNIPNGMGTIGEYAFCNCVSLMEVHNQNIIPQENSIYAFDNTDLSQCTLYVPKGTIEDYKNEFLWGEFGNYLEESVLTVNNRGQASIYPLEPGSMSECMKPYVAAIKELTVNGALNLSDIQYLKEVCRSYSLTSLFLEHAIIIGGDDGVMSEGLFSGFEKLTYLSLPLHTHLIEPNAFANCTNLETLRCLINVPPIASANAFSDVNALCKLIVPQNVMGKYETSMAWDFFATRIKGGDYIGDEEGYIYLEEPGTLRNKVLGKDGAWTKLTINGSLNSTDIAYLRNMSALVYLDLSDADIVTGGEGYMCGFGPPIEYTVTTTENSFPEWACLYLNNLKELKLPKSLRKIEAYSFLNYSNAFQVVIYENVQEISSAWGDNIGNIYCYAQTPPKFDLDGYLGERKIVYVPYGCKEAYSTAPGWINFEIVEMGCSYVNVPGTLKDVIQTLPTPIENLCISGSINGADIKTIREISTLRTLNLTHATIVRGGEAYYKGLTVNEDYAIPHSMLSELSQLKEVFLPDNSWAIRDSAFYNCNQLVVIQMPKELAAIGKSAVASTAIEELVIPRSLTQIGDKAFETNKSLLSIIWMSLTDIPADVFCNGAGDSQPNCLLYLYGNVDGDQVHCTNIIRDGIIEHLILKEGAYYAGLAFKAKKVSYNRNFSLSTEVGTAAGWTTIALPFNVQYYQHEEKGGLAPFGSEVEDTKPFWLRQLTKDGFQDALSVNANTPYIIAMPNNEDYHGEYNIVGSVTFGAENPDGIDIPQTPSLLTETHGRLYKLVPTFREVLANDSVYALNIADYNNNPAGSVFVKNSRMITPFEAYAISKEPVARAPLMYSIGGEGGEITGLEEIMKKEDESLKVYTVGNVLYIDSARDRSISIYDVTGRTVRVVEVLEGSNTITDLSSGFYFLEGKKVVIK